MEPGPALNLPKMLVRGSSKFAEVSWPGTELVPVALVEGDTLNLSFDYKLANGGTLKATVPVEFKAQ